MPKIVNPGWRQIWNDDIPGYHERFYCPECFGFNLFIKNDDVQCLYMNQPTFFSKNIGNRVKCECGWVGRFLDLLEKDEVKCKKRTELIDKMLI